MVGRFGCEETGMTSSQLRMVSDIFLEKAEPQCLRGELRCMLREAVGMKLEDFGMFDLAEA